jgi:anti-sigma factor RsiW
MDLTCRQLVELVTDHLDGALPVRERIRLEEHLLVCGACVRYADQIRATVRLSGLVELDGLGREGRRALLAALEPYLESDQ